MTLRRLNLRMRLMLAMGAMSLFTIAVIVAGMSAFYLITAEQWMNSFDPDIRDALMRLESGEPVSTEDLAFIASTYAQDWDTYYADAEGYALLLCSLLALILAVIVGYRVARRVSRPVEAVSTAARIVATGDLAARARFQGRSSSETEQLVRDFNALAEELERAERELSAGAAAIAHELRTPLTVLRGRLQGLYDGVYEFSPEVVNTLIEHVDGLSVIVDDLRTLGLGSSGRIVLSPEPVALDELACQVAAGYGAELKAAGLQVIYNLKPVTVMADPARLRQVLLALLDNARRYAASGGVATLVTDSEVDEARLMVMDHGPGVAPDQAQRLFDRFWRADPSRSRDSGGSGLGLAVVKAILTAHGGAVSCTQRDGGGLCFILHLPVKAGPEV